MLVYLTQSSIVLHKNKLCNPPMNTRSIIIIIAAINHTMQYNCMNDCYVNCMLTLSLRALLAPAASKQPIVAALLSWLAA